MMKTTIRLTIIAVLAAVLPPAASAAAESAATQPATHPPPQAPDLTVAILDFAASTPGAPELGSQIAEALTAMLSGEPGFQLVERPTLARTLQEHELSLSGVVDTEKAVQIGKVVGARILVTGKVFPLGKQIFMTGKVIGTETSLVEGVLVKGDLAGEVGDLIVEFGEKLGERLREKGPKLVASADAGADPLPRLKQALAGRKLPVVAVIVKEEHMRQPTAPQVIDPAVETEVKLLLRECGVTLKDVAQNELADWARLLSKDDVNAWPRGLHDVDIVITGEAFSEFGVRIGNLVSCSARAEINVISRKDGRIVLADRITTRAVDLSENIAAKKALEKAGRAMGVAILQHLAANQPTTRPERL